MAGPKISPDTKQTSTKGMHKRSRTGCFTCRLRRKKCDEGRASCRACVHLGLKCDYKRPMWWSNTDARKKQKEMIKDLIRATKLQEKAMPPGSMITSTPPGLCHSIPTSDTRSEDFERIRGGSLDSEFDFNAHVQFAPLDVFSAGSMPPPQFPLVMDPFGPELTPYEFDVKTEYLTFGNDLEMGRDSTTSSFSQILPPQPGHPFGEEKWIPQDLFDSPQQSFAEEAIGVNLFDDFDQELLSPKPDLTMQFNENDQYLLGHFLQSVVPLIFPVLDANEHASVERDIVLPTLEKNLIYASCCLAASAVHLKGTQGVEDDMIDQDIIRHRFNAVQGLCAALQSNEDLEQALDGTLAMIFYQSIIGRVDDGLRDIPWRTHFDQSAKGLIDNLDLSRKMIGSGIEQPPFNMTLASWIDIIGATIACRKPVYADVYREKNMSNSSAGLSQLMGCDDQIMFIISEIACLEASKADGLDDGLLCQYITMLGNNITAQEQAAGALESAMSDSGTIRPMQLCQNITNIFRIAARIYLCSIVPSFDRTQAQIISLGEYFADAMNYIPAGEFGFDRSLVWPLVVAGSVSLSQSRFRSMFEQRSAILGDAAELGSFGRATKLLQYVWEVSDDRLARGDRQGLHWREAMQQRDWDFLLI